MNLVESLQRRGHSATEEKATPKANPLFHGLQRILAIKPTLEIRTCQGSEIPYSSRLILEELAGQIVEKQKR